MNRIADRLRNGLYQRILDAAEAPLTRLLVRRIGRRLARWRRRRAAS